MSNIENNEENKIEESTTQEVIDNKTKPSTSGKIKQKILEFWKKLNIYEKITTVGLIVSVLLTVIAYSFGRFVSGFITILSIIILVVSLLMKKDIIKVTKKWISTLLLVLAFVLLIPYFSAFNMISDDYVKFNWNDIALSNILEKPKSSYGEIMANSDDYLSLYVNRTSEEHFNKYIESCVEKGFNIEIEQTGYSFDAYNEDGYKISLYYNDDDKQMHIGIDSAMELGTLKWSESELAQLVPIPQSNVGTIEKDDTESYVVYVGKTSKEDYKRYIDSCIEKGFNVNSNETEEYYSAKNDDSYKISIEYVGNNIMKINVYEQEYDININVECVENLIFSKYNVKVYIDGDYEDTLTHGTTETYKTVLKKGNHTLKFVNDENDDVVGEVKININKNEYFDFKISCTSSKIAVTNKQEKEQEKEEKNEVAQSTMPKITVAMSEEQFKGMEKSEAEQKLREMGFSVFKYDTISAGERADLHNKISSVEIKEWEFGNGDFSIGDTYESDAIVVIWSYKYTEPEKPRPVFYSTNDYETAKKGNTGVYSYKNKKGEYDIYWIINFDEGYVYWFTEGNGENTCDKVKIVSGDLNDKILITWHDSGGNATWGLHFKYVNHPETLVVNDHWGITTEFTTTDLDDALKLRDTKSILNY